MVRSKRRIGFVLIVEVEPAVTIVQLSTGVDFTSPVVTNITVDIKYKFKISAPG